MNEIYKLLIKIKDKMETINFFGFEASVNVLTFVVLYVCLITNVLIMTIKGQAGGKELLWLLPALIPLLSKFVYDFVLGEGVDMSPRIWITANSVSFLINAVLYWFVIEDNWIPNKCIGLLTGCQLLALVSFSCMLYGALCENMYGRIGFIVYVLVVILYVIWSVRLFFKNR